MSTPTEFYRYVMEPTENGNWYPEINLRLDTYKVIKETPCGYWIDAPNKKFNKWVRKSSKKSFAYPTKKEAMELSEKNPDQS